MKVCFKCGLEKDISQFYKHSAMKDGHLNKCKDCAKIDVRKNRSEKLGYYRKYDRERGNRQSSEDIKKYRLANIEKYKAHNAVNNAIRDGKLIKLPCEVCGKEHVHGHHDDYSKPLVVRWLCAEHHKAEHI